MESVFEPALLWLHRQETWLLGSALVLIVSSTVVYLTIGVARFALFMLRHAAKDLTLLKDEMQDTAAEFKKLIAKKGSGANVE